MTFWTHQQRTKWSQNDMMERKRDKITKKKISEGTPFEFRIILNQLIIIND